MDREIAHTRDLTELRVVRSMHERKALMAELADAFVALPGGAGTLDELFEIYTWSQLGIHAKPCGLLDVEGYWTGSTAFLDHAVARALPARGAPGVADRRARAGSAARAAARPSAGRGDTQVDRPRRRVTAYTRAR